MYNVGVIGAGSFGTAIANLLAENQKVLLQIRNKETFDKIVATRKVKVHTLHENVIPINDLEEFCHKCNVIYPMVDSNNFRSMCQSMRQFLKPYHIIIHGTKGLSVKDTSILDTNVDTISISRESVQTMSEVLLDETIALRIGCLSGPNLSTELAEKLPAAAVIASRFNEVINVGRTTIRSDRFKIYGSHDVIGVEIAGVLKNILAIAAGISSGLNLGENSKALLITRGLGEIIKLGTAFGSDSKAFMGVAGIGDLIATCSSSKSRNFTLGFNLAQGKKTQQILDEMQDTVEGIFTTKIAQGLSNHYKLETPIISTVYNVLFKDQNIKEALEYLMSHDFGAEEDYLY